MEPPLIAVIWNVMNAQWRVIGGFTHLFPVMSQHAPCSLLPPWPNWRDYLTALKGCSAVHPTLPATLGFTLHVSRLPSTSFCNYKLPLKEGISTCGCMAYWGETITIPHVQSPSLIPSAHWSFFQWAFARQGNSCSLGSILYTTLVCRLWLSTMT